MLILSAIVIIIGLVSLMYLMDTPLGVSKSFDKFIEGEQLIVDLLFRFSKVSNAMLKEYINVVDIDDDILEVISMFVHQYSKEGFLRYLESGRDEDYLRQAASVFVCHMLGISYDALFDNDHMERSEAELFIDMIEASK